MSKISYSSSMKELKNIRVLGCLLFFLAFSCVSTVHAYVLMDYKWPQPSTTFYVDISGSDALWNDAFEGAIYEWNAATVFKFYIVRGEYSDPCNSFDDRNGVRFSSTDCGDSWGSNTLAITHIWYIGSTITETDIVFNSNESWNVYWTSWSSYPWNGVSDFRRVAVHELGHALGLGHEDSGVSTIMDTYVDDTTIPQQDDINGVAAMYDSIPCTYSLSPTSKSVLSGGISSSVYVNTPSNCNWTASESLNWVSITSGFARTGSGSVYYSVAPNTTNIQRNGTMKVAGKSFTISQAAAPLITYYRDYDDDGYGNPSKSRKTTYQPSGYVKDDGDCNDYNKTIHPGAVEIRGDGIDQDCNGEDLSNLGCNDVPGKVSLTSPFASTQDTTPTYTWVSDPCATWYRLYVWDEKHAVKHSQWYEVSNICSEGICSVTPSALGGGSYEWYVQTWNENGYGDWSDGTSFIVDSDDGPPEATTLLTPDTAVNNPVTYTWNVVDGAVWYRLYVWNENHKTIQSQWYKSSATCSGGICSAVSPSNLADGDYEWYVRTWNEYGYGDWSSGMSFTVTE